MGQNHAFAFRQREDVLHNLLHTLPRDRRSADLTMGLADLREEQTHVVINLGYRTHC